MSLKKIVLEALAQNPVGLKEALTVVLAEKVCDCISKKKEEMEENISEAKTATAAAVMPKNHIDVAKRVHRDLETASTMSPSSAMALKNTHRELVRRYGKSWRERAGISTNKPNKE